MILTKKQLRPPRLTPLEIRALLVLDRGPLDAPALGNALRIRPRSAWYLAASLIEKGAVRLAGGVLRPVAS